MTEHPGYRAIERASRRGAGYSVPTICEAAAVERLVASEQTTGHAAQGSETPCARTHKRSVSTAPNAYPRYRVGVAAGAAYPGRAIT